MTLKTQLQQAEFGTGQTEHEVHLQCPRALPSLPVDVRDPHKSHITSVHTGIVVLCNANLH